MTGHLCQHLRTKCQQTRCQRHLLIVYPLKRPQSRHLLTISLLKSPHIRHLLIICPGNEASNDTWSHLHINIKSIIYHWHPFGGHIGSDTCWLQPNRVEYNRKQCFSILPLRVDHFFRSRYAVSWAPARYRKWRCGWGQHVSRWLQWDFTHIAPASEISLQKAETCGYIQLQTERGHRLRVHWRLSNYTK